MRDFGAIIMISTENYFYFARAYGTRGRNPYRGEILCKVEIDGNEDLINDMRKEISNGTYNASKEDDLPYEEAQRNGRRNSGRRPSLKEQLDAEGYGHLLDDQSDGNTEGVRGQSSGDSQSSRVKLSDRDSTGKQLSKGQQEFFKDSKVRDENGNLIRLYHGTERFGFTRINFNESDDGRSFFMTDNPVMAETLKKTWTRLSHP